VRLAGRAGTKVGTSDPAVRCGTAVAQRIKGQGLGCSPIKAVRELGSERRETVRSLSAARVGNLRKAVLSTRGPGRTNLWYVSCTARCMADWLRSGGITAESI